MKKIELWDWVPERRGILKLYVLKYVFSETWVTGRNRYVQLRDWPLEEIINAEILSAKQTGSFFQVQKEG